MWLKKERGVGCSFLVTLAPSVDKEQNCVGLAPDVNETPIKYKQEFKRETLRRVHVSGYL